MINLLPNEDRLHLRYGHVNSRLRRWIEIGILLIAILLVVLGSGWVYINKQVSTLNKSIAITQKQLQDQHLEQVQKQADQISENIRIINQVLAREILFSDLIQEIGKVMPPGAVLGTLNLTKVNGALDLSAKTKDYAAAAQIAVNLSDPANNIFEKVDIVNVNCQTTGITYPCTANFKALFGKKTPARFLNTDSGSKQ
ncbi:MAG TPA: hypothetical protein VFB03_01005 [Candidatus Saccharimonadales bacterium]|nr:hypothetical protein [Candidatus Saccharimonadales bacterium]